MKEFTLVSTVFNEINRIEDSIAQIERQEVRPSEIVITDAGSTDGTWERLLRWQQESAIPIVVLSKPACNVAQGRNMAIRAAKHEIIVSTDFGCQFEPGWTKALLKKFEVANTKVVGGGFGVNEEDIEGLPAKAAYLISGGYQLDPTADWFIPSSRSIAYYKEVFDAVGGYCEWLTLAADDLVFGKEIRSKGYQFAIAPEPLVFWGRHTAAAGYVKEAFRYGLGDGEARVNVRPTMVKLAELVLRVLFVTGVLVLLPMITSGKISAAYLMLLLICLPGFRPYWQLTKSWLRFKSSKYNLRTFLYAFLLLERTRWQYLKGFRKGYFLSTDSQKEAARLLNLRLKGESNHL